MFHVQALVKDLWSLRLPQLYSRSGDGYAYASDHDTDQSQQVFSSQMRGSSAAAGASASASASDADAFADDDDATTEEEENAYHRRRLMESPKLIDTLALCYLGLMLLRVPVGVGVLERCVICPSCMGFCLVKGFFNIYIYIEEDTFILTSYTCEENKSWILKDEIPLIRAIRFIPQDMKDRLPATYHYALDTKVC